MTAPAAAQQPVQYAPPAPVFPQLPPSRPCTAKEVPGVWKLLRVFETPSGAEMSAFLSNPVQFILFDANSTYGKYIGNAELPPASIRGEIAKQVSGLQQYLVDASGMVFFYQDRASTDTQACFIVVTPVEPFAAGQMLLMPPEGTIKGRMVKVYIRVNEQPPPQPRRGRGRRR